MAKRRGLRLRIPLTFTGMLSILVALAVVIGVAFFALVHLEGVDAWIKQAVPLAAITLGILGAVIAVLHASGLVRIHLKCPFCKEYAELDFRYQEGFAGARPVLDCAKCGTVVNVLRFGVKAGRERVSVCPSCGHEFGDTNDGQELRCPECGWSEADGGE